MRFGDNPGLSRIAHAVTSYDCAGTGGSLDSDG